MKKLCVTIGIMIILILNLAVVSNAASAKLQTSISSEKIQPGKEVVVVVKIEDVDAVSRGFNALTGILEYDTNVFETVQSKDFKMLNNWDAIIYNPSNKMFATAKAEGIKTGEAIFELTLKAKSDVEAGDYTIKIKDFTVSEGIEDVVLGENDVTVEIVKSSTETGNGTSTSNGNDNSTTTDEEDNNVVENNSTNQNNAVNNQTTIDNKVNTAVDKAEQSYTLWIIIAVCVAVVAIAVVAYAVKKNREKE